MNIITEQIIPTIAAIEPCYGEGGGNATRVYTTDGRTFTDRRRLKSVLEAILRFYTTNLPVIRKKYGGHLQCKHYVPLPLSRDMVLFQFKARAPQFLHDGASGYINYYAVKDITAPTPAAKEKGAGSLIQLTGGHLISSCYTLSKMEERKGKAATAIIYFEKQHGYGSNYPALVRENGLKGEFRCPLLHCCPYTKLCQGY